MAKRLHERWEITGPDGEGYCWLNIEDPDGKHSHINLGTFDQVGEKFASWLAAADFGER